MKGLTKNQTKKIDCPVAKASLLVGDMWTLLIIRELLRGTKRFKELQSAITTANSKCCINSRTLTERLKKLESEDVIAREVFQHEIPPRVEYKLTKKGEALSKILDDLKKFGEKYL